DVDALPRKMEKRHHRYELEEGQLDPVTRHLTTNLCRQLDHLILLDLAGANPDALGEPDEMGRDVESYPVSGSSQHRVQHGRHRPFAVRAGHVNARKVAMRIAEALEAESHTLELEVHALRRFERVQPIEGGLIVAHCSIVGSGQWGPRPVPPERL